MICYWPSLNLAVIPYWLLSWNYFLLYFQRIFPPSPESSNSFFLVSEVLSSCPFKPPPGLTQAKTQQDPHIIISTLIQLGKVFSVPDKSSHGSSLMEGKCVPLSCLSYHFKQIKVLLSSYFSDVFQTHFYVWQDVWIHGKVDKWISENLPIWFKVRMRTQHSKNFCQCNSAYLFHCTLNFLPFT